MYLSDELFQRSRKGYFCVYFPSYEATREINTKMTLERAQKQFVTKVHTLFYFLHDITIHKWRWKRRSLHIDPVSHSLGLRSADDVTIDRWWRHNNKTNCDAITWIVISNSLDIDFIHGDIHGWSCKKVKYMIMVWDDLVWFLLNP